MPTPRVFPDRTMWPWGHAAVGYLLYSGYSRLTRRGPNADPGAIVLTDMQVLALGVGTQLPDLVDKPLAWQFDILPNGRSLGHSLVVFAILAALAWVLIRRPRRRRLLGAFGLGYLSHLGTDGLYPALRGEFAELGYLGYPIVRPISYPDISGGFLAHLLALDFGPTGYVEIGLAVAATVVWYADGLPGLRLLIPAWGPETERQPE